MGIIKYSRYYSSKWLQRPNSVPTRSTRLCPDAVADSFPRMVGLTTSSLQRLAASNTRRSSLSSLPGPWHGEPTTRRLKLTNFRRRNLEDHSHPEGCRWHVHRGDPQKEGRVP